MAVRDERYGREAEGRVGGAGDRMGRLRKSAYTAAQWTWGLPQTLIGAGLYLAHRRDRHFDYNGATATVWDRKGGVSLGKFIFVPRCKSGAARSTSGADSFILDHEYGHTLQSLILGPAYLLLVGAPSLLWNRLPVFRRHREKTGQSYYSVPFEKSANALGARSSRRRPGGPE